MPVYEYACKACGHHLEVSQSFKDEPLTECPVCGGQLRKVFHSIGVVLKGSGFYRTDSRLPAKKPSESKSESSEKSSAGGSGSDGGSEKKSEPAKSESKSSDSKSSDSSSTKSA